MAGSLWKTSAGDEGEQAEGRDPLATETPGELVGEEAEEASSLDANEDVRRVLAGESSQGDASRGDDDDEIDPEEVKEDDEGVPHLSVAKFERIRQRFSRNNKALKGELKDSEAALAVAEDRVKTLSEAPDRLNQVYEGLEPDEQLKRAWFAEEFAQYMEQNRLTPAVKSAIEGFIAHRKAHPNEVLKSSAEPGQALWQDGPPKETPVADTSAIDFMDTKTGGVFTEFDVDPNFQPAILHALVAMRAEENDGEAVTPMWIATHLKSYLDEQGWVLENVQTKKAATAAPKATPPTRGNAGGTQRSAPRKKLREKEAERPTLTSEQRLAAARPSLADLAEQATAAQGEERLPL